MDADRNHSARCTNRQACSASCPANQVAVHRANQNAAVDRSLDGNSIERLSFPCLIFLFSMAPCTPARRPDLRGAPMLKIARRSAVHGVCAAAALALSPVTTTTQAEPD